MHLKIKYKTKAGFEGNTYSLNDWDGVDVPIRTELSLSNCTWDNSDGRPFASLTLTGGNAGRSVAIRGEPHELRMLAADLNKMAAWLESPNVEVEKKAVS